MRKWQSVPRESSYMIRYIVLFFFAECPVSLFGCLVMIIFPLSFFGGGGRGGAPLVVCLWSCYDFCDFITKTWNFL